MGESRLTGCYCSMQGPAVGKVTDVFSLPTACIGPSNAVKTDQQEGVFHTASDCFLYPAAKPHFSLLTI